MSHPYSGAASYIYANSNEYPNYSRTLARPNPPPIHIPTSQPLIIQPQKQFNNHIHTHNNNTEIHIHKPKRKLYVPFKSFRIHIPNPFHFLGNSKPHQNQQQQQQQQEYWSPQSPWPPLSPPHTHGRSDSKSKSKPPKQPEFQPGEIEPTWRWSDFPPDNSHINTNPSLSNTGGSLKKWFSIRRSTTSATHTTANSGPTSTRTIQTGKKSKSKSKRGYDVDQILTESELIDNISDLELELELKRRRMNLYARRVHGLSLSPSPQPHHPLGSAHKHGSGSGYGSGSEVGSTSAPYTYPHTNTANTISRIRRDPMIERGMGRGHNGDYDVNIDGDGDGDGGDDERKNITLKGKEKGKGSFRLGPIGLGAGRRAEKELTFSMVV